MRILVYGAGVLGCELAHVLVKAGHTVTLLARGEWKNILKEKGLTIRHCLQCHTTHDKVYVIDKLDSKDAYDLIFVVMQQGQIPEVLPVLSRNSSEYIVFLGNDMEAPRYHEELIKTSITKKEIAFGFQSTGGRREGDKVVSLHVALNMTVGALDGELSHEFKKRLRQAFTGAKYRLNKELHMDAWLKCHAAFILPLCFICYATDGNLKKATKKQINESIDATIEAHEMLKKLGYPIRPDGEEEYFTNTRKKCYHLIKLLAKTPAGRLAISDHAMKAKGEMKSMDESFERLRIRAGEAMPTWEVLRGQCKIAGKEFVNE